MKNHNDMGVLRKSENGRESDHKKSGKKFAIQ